MTSAPQASPRRTTWGKNALLLAASVLLSVAALELGALVLYRPLRDRAFSRAEIQGRLLRTRVGAATSPEQNGDAELESKLDQLKNAEIPDHNVIIHPYYGFIIDPRSPGINRFGFFEDEPFTTRGPDRVIVAVFGGSLADQVFYLGKEAMTKRLARHPRFRDKNIHIVSLALGGYKQPQQMIILSDLLVHGAEYDIVVNIDGFNEVDSSLDNYADGINPFYPHSWKLHARQGIDTENVARVGRIEIARGRRRTLRSVFRRFPLRASVFGLSLWDVLDHRYLMQIRQEMADLDRHLTDKSLPPRVTGPTLSFDDAASVYRNVALVWERSSVHMARLCELHGIAYFHFLQPNQYVPDSKRFTEEELRVAVRPDVYTFGEHVRDGFPHLRARAADLERQGVHFTDLTMVFKDERRTMYNDPCCHVNETGAEIIATKIADVITARLPVDRRE